MPKIKTHKGTARRFHVTGTGKVVRTKGPKSHLRRKKASRVARQLDKKVGTSANNARRVRRLLGM